MSSVEVYPPKDVLDLIEKASSMTIDVLWNDGLGEVKGDSYTLELDNGYCVDVTLSGNAYSSVVSKGTYLIPEQIENDYNGIEIMNVIVWDEFGDQILIDEQEEQRIIRLITNKIIFQ